LHGDSIRSPSPRGLGIDLADLNAFDHLEPTAIERAARRWLSPAERAWCAAQPSFRLAMVMVLSCKESVCKASGGSTPVSAVTLDLEGVWPRGGARATGAGREPVTLWWEATSCHILTVAVEGAPERTAPILDRIIRGRSEVRPG
jgi:phosphopantetheinyl transferase